MQDWKLLPYFLAAVRGGSLRAAAEQTGATHATVRRQLEALEDSYGVKLFRRGQDGLHLTAAGKTLLPAAIEAEQVILRGRHGVQGKDREARGTVRLSMDPMTAHFLMAPILAEFSALYPDISLEMRLGFQVDHLSKLETDVSIRHAADPMENVVARKLFPLGIAIMASRGYIDTALPKAGKGGEGLSWIGYGPEPEMRRWIAHAPFPKAAIRHQVEDPEMHMHMVRAGMGMSFLALWTQSVFPELQRVPGTEVDYSRSTWLLLHEDLRHVARVRVLVDFIADALRQRRAEISGL
ncbi:MAG: LysR family transcriptional regulator [Marivivens sp.]|nr:LysR family transcriptional regulator [Marivivens sp.]